LPQPHDSGIDGQLEFLDQNIEGALAVPVRVLSAGRVVGVRAFTLRHYQYLLASNEEELGMGVDEPLDEPGTGDPVDVGVLSRDPLHGSYFGDSTTVARPSRLR